MNAQICERCDSPIRNSWHVFTCAVLTAPVPAEDLQFVRVTDTQLFFYEPNETWYMRLTFENDIRRYLRSEDAQDWKVTDNQKTITRIDRFILQGAIEYLGSASPST